MTLVVREITPQRIAEVDKANVDIGSWFDDDWRCAASPDVRYPSRTELRNIVQSDRWALIVIFDDADTVVYGIAVVRVADARVNWLVAEKSRFGQVIVRLCQAVAAQTGMQPWGVLERDVIQQRFVDSGRFESFDHPKYPGQAFRFV